MTRTTTVIVPLTLLGALVALNLGGCKGAIDEAAEKQFMSRLGSMSLTIFPACVHSKDFGYDRNEAVRIAEFFNENKLATSTVADAEVPLTTEWGMNQSRMYRDSLKQFQVYLADHPVSTDYALLPEYLVGGRGDIVGVHLYVVSRDGTPSYGVGLNSHHDEFNAVDPKSPADATDCALRKLHNELGSKSATQARPDGLDPDTAVASYPVLMGLGARQDVADTIGLLQDQAGMSRHVTAETRLIPARRESPAALA